MSNSLTEEVEEAKKSLSCGLTKEALLEFRRNLGPGDLVRFRYSYTLRRSGMILRPGSRSYDDHGILWKIMMASGNEEDSSASLQGPPQFLWEWSVNLFPPAGGE